MITTIVTNTGNLNKYITGCCQGELNKSVTLK